MYLLSIQVLHNTLILPKQKKTASSKPLFGSEYIT